MSHLGVALIRGINVGKAKRVAMADLRALFEELGCSGVGTVLQSGNVVFTAPWPPSAAGAGRIETAMASRFGFSARVLLLTAGELETLVADNPLVAIADDPSRLLAAVLPASDAVRPLRPLLEQEWLPEALALGERAAYLWCPAGVLASRLPQAVERAAGGGVTMRNWRTVLRVQALVRKGE